MQRLKTQPSSSKIYKQFRLHTSSTNTRPSANSAVFMTLSFTALNPPKPPENNQQTYTKKYNDNKVVTRKISIQRPKMSSRRFKQQEKDEKKQNQMGYLDFARPSSFKHRSTKTVVMHEVKKPKELLVRSRPSSPRKVPKNFLIGNSIYTNIKLGKKVKDFVYKRKEQYYDNVLQNI